MRLTHSAWRRRPAWIALALVLAMTAAGERRAKAHIIPPETLHPAAESYRRLGFLLELNPVLWEAVRSDAERIAEELFRVSPEEGAAFRREVESAIEPWLSDADPPSSEQRKRVAARLFESSTRAVARALNLHLEAARDGLDDHRAASRSLDQARQLWASFEPMVLVADPGAHRRMGECWLELESALGYPGLLGRGEMPSNPVAFAEDSSEIIGYVETHFGDRFRVSSTGGLAALPAGIEPAGRPEPRLPPGSQVNKQLPRPRQVLNMVVRGVDESETTLIALGDLAFDSALLFGEPAASMAITCNTCHNKGVTNPAFFIPGLSARPGGMDVSNSFFAPHANNGHFDPLDIPDLRGIRFTAPYGRNGRFASLREFVRNVVVNEFNGPEPDPMILDGLMAYLLEFDFLPNPKLAADGSLSERASEAERRGETLFRRPFEGMGGRSCATCHVPSDHFLDRRSHDLGSVAGAEEGSLDRALDTPTLLGSLNTPPYFHDGSLPTLEAVVEWFDGRFSLGLSGGERSDLTRYLEAVGGGVEAYEDTIHTLEAEMEEFSFFLSTYEYLKSQRRPELIDLAFGTVAFEIRAHKWDIQDESHLPTLDRLAALLDEARVSLERRDQEEVDRKVAEYRRLYLENAEVLR